MIRILCALASPIFSTALAHFIGQKKSLYSETDLMIKQLDDISRIISCIQEFRPDIIVMDSYYPNASGLEKVKDIAASYKGIKILVLSSHDETVYAERFLKAGVNGFIQNTASMEEFQTAMKAVMKGSIYISDALQKMAISRLITQHQGTLPQDRLTDRELEVFEMLGRGKTSREISQYLRLAFKTIESYRHNIRTKLGFANCSQLVSKATEWVKDTMR